VSYLQSKVETDKADLTRQLHDVLEKANLTCSHSLPVEEPPLKPDSAIALFRIVEEALHHILHQKTAKSIVLRVAIDGAHLTVSLTYYGLKITERDNHEFPEFASMHHRVWKLNGTLDVLSSGEGESTLTASISLADTAVRPDAESLR
jgi:signal transduction histidine kinase